MKIRKMCLVVFLTVFCSAVWGLEPASGEMSNYELEQEIRELKEKLNEQDGILDKAEIFKELSERVSISGAIEIEAFTAKNYDSDSESDIALATVELGFDVQIAEWVSGHVLLLWEEDDTEEVVVDEGTITLGNTEKCPFYLTAGKLYVPFGVFESNMIQDPLTLEIGETRESAVQVGVEMSGFYGSVYVFNGDISEKNDTDKVECYGANIGYGFENDDLGFDIGVDWINNIADSDGLTDAVSGSWLPAYGILGIRGEEEIEDYVEGVSAHLILNFGPVMLIGEYLGACDDFETNELAFNGDGAQPEAWNIEVAFAAEIAGKETVFALGYQGTDEALALELPEERYMAAVSVGIIANTCLTFEYLHDKDYDESDGGTDDDADVFTAQLAIEF